MDVDGSVGQVGVVRKQCRRCIHVRRLDDRVPSDRHVTFADAARGDRLSVTEGHAEVNERRASFNGPAPARYAAVCGENEIHWNIPEAAQKYTRLLCGSP